jgi:hypothetical protein
MHVLAGDDECAAQQGPSPGADGMTVNRPGTDPRTPSAPDRCPAERLAGPAGDARQLLAEPPEAPVDQSVQALGTIRQMHDMPSSGG